MLHLQNPSNGNQPQPETPRLIDELDCSACSTPYVSAPSSPGRGSPSATANSGGYFYSAPASPVHYMLMTSVPSAARPLVEQQCEASLLEFEFEFSSSRFSGTGGAAAAGSMSSADELFFNGQIRPMKLSSHLQRPQILAPLMDTEGEDYDDDDDGESVKRGRDLKLRSRSLHRKARSLSPLRSAESQWPAENRGAEDHEEMTPETAEAAPESETTPSGSASSSRSSSSGRNSKKWIFLKDLLYRSKSEGRNNGKEKFWSSIAFSPSKVKKLSENTNNAPEKEKQKSTQKVEEKKNKETRQPRKSPAAARPANGVSKRRMTVSAHELHYTSNRAQAEEMKKRTYLPYRQGLLGCLGFSSKGYGALNGLARTLSPVSSR